jgi:hypothetical protein
MAVEPPRPGTISADQFCEFTGKTDRRHRQLAKEGWFPQPFKGQYQAKACLSGYIKYLDTQLAKRDDTEKIEKGLLAKVKRETGQEELAILRKEYVPKDQIGPALRNLSLHQRAVLQRKLESELGPNLAGLKTPEIRVRTARAVDEICNVFRDGVRTWLEKEP